MGEKQSSRIPSSDGNLLTSNRNPGPKGQRQVSVVKLKFRDNSSLEISIYKVLFVSFLYELYRNEELWSLVRT